MIVTFVGLFATTDFTSSGIPPGAYAAQPRYSTFSMFIQKTTSCAVTVSPFENLYGFIVNDTTVLPFEYAGLDASESEGFSVGLLPFPNQYSGRYIGCCRSEMLLVLKKARLMNGKM